MGAFWYVLGPVIAAAVTGIVAYLVNRRKNSGTIETSDADVLWAASERMREELRAEADLARRRTEAAEKRASVAEERAALSEDRAQKAEKEIYFLRQEVFELRVRLGKMDETLKQHERRTTKLEAEQSNGKSVPGQG